MKETIDFLKKYTDGKQNTEKVEMSVLQLNRVIKALEQELCEDEYIKVPKKALKYRTAGMVAYNAEWLKNHFDVERAVICGVQEPKTEALDKIRAEVEALPKTYPFVNHIDMYVKEDDVRKIIEVRNK